MRPHTVVVIAPRADDHLSFLEAVEDLQLQALVPELCSEMAASLQARAMLLPCASCTSIWRSLAMICSGLNLFFGMGGSLVPGQLSPSTWSNSTQSGQFLAGMVAGMICKSLSASDSTRVHKVGAALGGLGAVTIISVYVMFNRGGGYPGFGSSNV